MMPEWKSNKYGWGQTLTLAKGVKIHVDKSLHPDEGFYWSALGTRSTPTFTDIERAKELAVAFVTAQIKKAYAALEIRSEDD